MDYKLDIENISKEYLKENNIEILEANKIVEDGNTFLRITLDAKDINLDDVTNFTRFLNKKLDEKDIFDFEYFLDIQSSGKPRQIDLDKLDQMNDKFIKIILIDGRKLVGQLKINNEIYYIQEDNKGRIKKHEFHVIDVAEAWIGEYYDR